MDRGVVAEIRSPNDDEILRLRELWGALQQTNLPVTGDTGIELQSYLKHCAWIVGMIAGVNSHTGEDMWPNSKAIAVSQDGVARIRDAVRMLTAILALYTPAGQQTSIPEDKPS